MLSWLVRRFGSAPRGLVEAAVRLGESPFPLGDAAVVLRALPLLPVAFALWEGDGELSPGGTVLFDETAPSHLATEDLAVVACEALAALVRTQGRQPPSGGEEDAR